MSGCFWNVGISVEDHSIFVKNGDKFIEVFSNACKDDD